MAGKYDITCDGGSTLRRVLTWLNPDETPVQLGGYTARMHVRPKVDSEEILLVCTTENGRISLEELTGKITIVVEAEETALLAGESGRYDLEMVDAGGFVTRLVEGKFKVTAEVTR